jgi:hypothetical protein
MDPRVFQKRGAYGGVVNSRFQADHNRHANAVIAHFFGLVQVTDKTLWYVDRHGKLTGYDGRTRRYIGSLDPHGPDGSLASEPFLTQPNYYYYYNPYDENPSKVLVTAKTAYQVDFKARTLKPLFSLTNDDEIGGYSVSSAGYDAASRPGVLITTRQTVRLLDSEGRTLVNVPYQPGCSDYPQVQLNCLLPTNGLKNTYAIWFHPDGQMNQKADWKMPIHVVWVAPEDVVSKSADLPVLRDPGSTPWRDAIATSLVPPPLLWIFAGEIFRPWGWLTLALCIISAVIGGLLARRYHCSTGAAAGWTVFIFVVGFVGLLTFLCVQEWPAREICPKCKKLRAVDRENCEHCDSPFPPPGKNGTEIFGSLTKV